MNAKRIVVAVMALSGLAGLASIPCSHAVFSMRNSSPAQDGMSPRLEIKGIRVLGLQEYSGKNLTVFYVSGREGLLGMPGGKLIVNALKGTSRQVRITESGEALIPPRLLMADEIEVFNFLVFVVHDQERVFLKSADGAILADPRAERESTRESEYEYLSSWFIARQAVDELQISQRGSREITITSPVTRR